MRHALRQIILNAPVKTSFELALKTSLVPEKAVNGTPTLTRSSIKSIVDFEGIVRTCKAGEVGYVGARRIENLIRGSSEDLTISPWAASISGTGVTPGIVANAISNPLNGAITASQVTLNRGAGNTSTNWSMVRQTANESSGRGAYQGSLWLKGTSGEQIAFSHVSAGDYVIITFTGNWQRISKNETYYTNDIQITNRGGYSSTNNVTFYVYGVQLEDSNGQSNQNPSECVSSNEASTGALGVKYFSTLNGNTVVNNVVTEAQGAAIPEATLKGANFEGARTSVTLWTRDLTNAAWVQVTTTIAKTAAGIDGAANSASTLTATGTDSTILQTVTLASSVRVFQPYIKRVTGTGAISITTNNGATWTDVTAQLNSSTYTQVQFSQTVTNPVFGFKLATSGDVIAVDYADNQGGAFASSPISTTTAAVTRASDALSYPTAGNLNAAAGAIKLEFTPEHAPSGTIFLFGSYVDSDNATLILHDATSLIARKRIAGTNYDATIANAFVSGTTYKIAMSWGSSGLNIAVAGVLGTANNNSIAAQLGTTIQIGADGNSLQQSFGSLKSVKFYPKQLKTAKLIQVTS